MFKRVKRSIAGVVIGCLLIPGSVLLHAWNEYRTIHRSRGLAEAAQVVVSVSDPSNLDPELEDQLVHVSGHAATDETLVDELFGIRENAIHLARRTEMYQWVESTDQNREGHTEYNYDQRWAPGRVNSSGFHRSGHDNPEAHYSDLNVTADVVSLGAYQLSKSLKSSMDHWEAIDVNEAAILETLGDEAHGQHLVIENQLYWSTEEPSPDSPQLGDQRIRFEVVRPNDVSLVSRQRDNSFVAFTTSNGEEIERLYMGTLTAEQVFEKLVTENTIIAWALRALGFAICTGGFSLALGPIRALFSWIPLVGDLTGGLLFLAGALMAAIVSLTTISIAWIAVRPLLGIALLVISAVLGYVIVRLKRSAADEAPIIDASMLVE